MELGAIVLMASSSASLTSDAALSRGSGRMRHVLSALVQNQPGVLAHVSGMFASRGFNIDSLAVGETEEPHLSRITVVVYAQDNPYQYVEIRGTASGSTAGADEQIDRLAKKYMGVDEYPMRVEGEQRISYVIDVERVRLNG